MPKPEQIYTSENCRVAYQLNWSLSLFWNAGPIAPDTWLDQLKPLTEKDGVRILEHRIKDSRTSQFFVSTRPDVPPPSVARSVKGRLQHHIRAQQPRAFRGNYSIKSVGQTNLSEVRGYLDLQLDRHRMADPVVQDRLKRFQIDDAEIDLASPRKSSNAQFIFNLHIVLVHEGRWGEAGEERLAKTRDMLLKTAAKKGHLLAKARILSDHIHMMIGCDIKETPMDVALAYLNNIAYVHEMRPVFQFGFFLGTFGEYDRGAVRRAL